MKKILVVFLSLLVFGCAKRTATYIENKIGVGFLGQKGYLIRKGKSLWYWNGKNMDKVGVPVRNIAFGTNDAAIISGRKLYFLDLSNQSLFPVVVGKGETVDYSGGLWLVKNNALVSIYSNEKKVSLFNYDGAYNKIKMWNHRMVVSLSGTTLRFFTLGSAGILSAEDKIDGVIDFDVNPLSPVAYVARKSNKRDEIFSYQLYSGQKKKIDVFPAVIQELRYNPDANMLIVRGKGLLAFYFLASGRIQMAQIDSDAVAYRNSDRQLLILKGDKLISLDFKDKTTNIQIGLPEEK